jgi:hypothetical protein
MLGFKETVICLPFVIFRHKREEVTGENYIMRSFMVFIPQQFFIQVVRENKVGGKGKGFL